MKKVLCLLLTAVLFFSLAGCGLGGKTLYLPEKVEAYSGGELSQTITYQYDEDGFLTKILSNNGQNSDARVITCDKNGNVLSSSADQSSGLSAAVGLAYTYTYSTRGNLLSETWSINGQVQNETNWEYNSKHQVTRAIHEGKLGSTMEYLYEYGKDGKLLMIRGILDEKQVSTTAFEYDKQGRLVLETLCNDRETVIQKVEYRYEENKTVAEVHRADYGNMIITYTFDHAGNITEMVYGEGGDHLRYVYTYKEVKVSEDSPRRSYTGQRRALSATGLTTLWE